MEAEKSTICGQRAGDPGASSAESGGLGPRRAQGTWSSLRSEECPSLSRQRDREREGEGEIKEEGKGEGKGKREMEGRREGREREFSFLPPFLFRA